MVPWYHLLTSIDREHKTITHQQTGIKIDTNAFHFSLDMFTELNIIMCIWKSYRNILELPFFKLVNLYITLIWSKETNKVLIAGTSIYDKLPVVYKI